MPRTEKIQDARAFTFRMPRDKFDVLSAVAKSRDVDVSSVLNWIITESMPHLLREKADHEERMLSVATSKVWARQPSPADALRMLRELLAELQAEYEKLVKEAIGDKDRRAA
jgi:hypothetical protein